MCLSLRRCLLRNNRRFNSRMFQSYSQIESTMRTIRFYFIFGIIVLTCSCSKSYSPSSEEVVLDPAILNTALELNVEKETTLSNLGGVEAAYVYEDSIIITHNRGRQEEGFIKVFDKNFNLIKELFREGNGKDELISALVSWNGSSLIVNDFLKGQIANVDLDKLLSDKQYIPSIITYQDKLVFTVCVDDDSTLVMANPFYFHDEKTGIQQGDRRLIRTTPDKSEIASVKYPFNTFNVSGQGFLIPSPSRDTYLYASRSESAVEVYNKDLSLQKTIYGPKTIAADYRTEPVPQNDTQEVLYQNQHLEAYTSCCSDSEHAYFLYYGNLFTPGEEEAGSETYILQYDWDGSLSNCYVTKLMLRTISKGRGEHVFYGSLLDDEGEVHLVKLNTGE